MTKLNGWKRIGIVASVVWILGAGPYAYQSQISRDSKGIAYIHVDCDSDLTGRTGNDWQRGFDECNKVADESLAMALREAEFHGALVAFIPVPLGWGLAYLILFLVRWVKRGFMERA